MGGGGGRDCFIAFFICLICSRQRDLQEINLFKNNTKRARCKFLLCFFLFFFLGGGGGVFFFFFFFFFFLFCPATDKRTFCSFFFRTVIPEGFYSPCNKQDVGPYWWMGGCTGVDTDVLTAPVLLR